MLTFLQTGTDHSYGEAGLGIMVVVFYLALIVFILLTYYKIYKKAGRNDAWAAFIPIYGTIVRMDIIKQPWWRFLLYLIPLAGLYFAIVDINRLSKFFGKDESFTVGLVLLSVIFFPILAFGDAKYKPNALPDNR